MFSRKSSTDPSRKRRRRILAISVLLIPVAAGSMILWAGAEIASPSRRPLMDFHRDFLTNQAAHGVQIAHFTASDGTPCIVCSPEPAGVLGKRGQIIREQLTTEGHTLKPAGSIIGTLVLVHGRRGRKEDYLPIAERLCAAGFRCVIPDLPAHGDHPGTVATYGVREAALPSTVLEEAAQRYAFDPEPAGLLGMSMGGSVAIHAAALPGARWKALAIVSSFDSFPATIESQTSRYIGSTLGPLWAEATAACYHWKSGLPLARIQPYQHAAKLRIPTLIAHGSDDDVVTMASGRRLLDAFPATTQTRWVEIPGANHDNVLITSYPIYADLAAWMLRHVAVR